MMKCKVRQISAAEGLLHVCSLTMTKFTQKRSTFSCKGLVSMLGEGVKVGSHTQTVLRWPLCEPLECRRKLNYLANLQTWNQTSSGREATMLNYCAIPSFGLLDTEASSPRQVSLFSSALIVHVKQCFDIFLCGPPFQPAWWFSLLISLHTTAKWSGEPPFHPLVLHLTPFSLSVSWQLQPPLIAAAWEQEIFFIFRGWNDQGLLWGEK